MKIRHLALALPLTRADVTSMDSDSQKTEDDLQKAVNFFEAVQSRGRMRLSLNLKTLTLVLGDPIMFMKIDDKVKHGVRAFSDLVNGDEHDLTNMLAKAVLDCRNSLEAPHSLIQGHNHQVRPTMRNSWGAPEIFFKLIERQESKNPV